MTPFLYPKTRHVRTLNPGPYKDYRTYKPYLQTEFGRKCVYCRKPDGLTPAPDDFGVDHYQPQHLFPELETTYANLFYCCNACNSRKGKYWPRNLKTGPRIPNPCDHEMFRHLRFVGSTVVPQSAWGEFTEALLDLNAKELVDHRDFVALTLSAFAQTKAGNIECQAAIRKKIANGEMSAAEAAADLATIDAAIAAADAAMSRLLGTSP